MRVDDAFLADFPVTPTRELAGRYGVSERTIARWATKLGLRKNAEYRSAVARAIRAKLDPSLLQRGPTHWNWKGGRPWERFRDPRYLAWRNAVLARDAYTCERCGRVCKKYERGLAAHHIFPWAESPATRFDLSNGMTLCRACHMELHGRAPTKPALIPCACGCGTMIPSRDPYGRPRRYVIRHAKRGKRMSAESRAKLSASRRGRRLDEAHRAKISLGLRTSSHRIGRPPRKQSES
jgi:hypothetical protein